MGRRQRPAKQHLRRSLNSSSFHNRRLEEDQMWSTWERERRGGNGGGRPPGGRRRPASPPTSRLRMDQIRSGNDSARRREGDRLRRPELDTAIRRARRSSQQSLYWNKKLIDFEERDPDRWGHSGFKELYLEGAADGDSRRRSPARGRPPERPGRGGRGSAGGGRGGRPAPPKAAAADDRHPRRRSPSRSSSSSSCSTCTGSSSSRSRSRSRTPRSRSPIRARRRSGENRHHHRRRSSSSDWSTSSSTTVTSRSVSPRAQQSVAKPAPGGARANNTTRPRAQREPARPPAARKPSPSKPRPPREPPKPSRAERPATKEVARRPERDGAGTGSGSRRPGAAGPTSGVPPTASEKITRKVHNAPAERRHQRDRRPVPDAVSANAGSKRHKRRRAAPDAPPPPAGRSSGGRGRPAAPATPAAPPPPPPPPAGSETGETSSSSGSEPEAPRTSLSERFGRLAQLSVQRGDQELVRLKIVKDSNSSEKKVILEEEPGAAAAPGRDQSAERISFETEYREYFGRKLRRPAVTEDPDADLPRRLPRDWETDVRVRYRYYRDAGYFRDHMLSLEDYVKWEQWWYRYREWLRRETARRASLERLAVARPPVRTVDWRDLDRRRPY